MHLMHSPSVVFGVAAASAPTAMCKVKLSVWRLVKMSGLTGQHRAPSQHLTNLHSSFYRVGVEPEIHATFPNTAHVHAHKHREGHGRRHRLKYAIHVWPWCCSINGRKANWWAAASDRSPQRAILTTLSTTIRRKSQRPFHWKNLISSFSIDSIWTKPVLRLCKVRRAEQQQLTHAPSHPKWKRQLSLQMLPSHFLVRFLHYAWGYCNHLVQSNHTDEDNKSDWVQEQKCLGSDS